METEYSGSGRRPWQILSGTGMKIAGIILMVLDHVRQMFTAWGAPDWLGWFGRPVAAMFLFLCAEGFFYTRNKKRYMLRLLAGFLFMSVMNLILSALMFMEDINLINNIFGALFLAAFYMWMLDCLTGGIREKSPAKILLAIGGFLLPFAVSLAMILALQDVNRTAVMVLLFIPNPLSVEGGLVLLFLGVSFYAARKYRIVQAALILAVGAVTWYSSRGVSGEVQWLMVFSVIPVLMYNGTRGKGGKYFFYVFYPAHIYLLYCAAWLLRGWL